jgi:hypothetical protein
LLSAVIAYEIVNRRALESATRRAAELSSQIHTAGNAEVIG